PGFQSLPILICGCRASAGGIPGIAGADAIRCDFRSHPEQSIVPKSVDPAQRLAALGDVRRCLAIAAEIGELEVIEGVHPHLEMGALYELSLQKPVPPILLFRKIKGFPDDYRVACNIRSSRVFNDGVGLELVQNYRKGKRQQAEAIPPRAVTEGP